MKTQCPFKVGDSVIYMPSDKGYFSDPPDFRLIKGSLYKIERIENGSFIVVEGYNHPGGGLYWEEFEKADDNSTK